MGSPKIRSEKSVRSAGFTHELTNNFGCYIRTSQRVASKIGTN